ncbi:MAG: hypothetical protein JO033_00530 [Acidobacteriaceae bacterium]|nr:hypothetical protein [Acidobacteriaceae bacterium]MBV9499580.1 hypothetical protein [Acidobacteriaceae bacterium]
MTRTLILSVLCVLASVTLRSQDLQQLREKVAQQEEQIKHLQQAVEEQKTLLDQALKSSATATVSGAPTTVPGRDGTAAAITNSNPDSAQLVPVANAARPQIAPIPRQKVETRPSPLSISLGNTTLTPLGFVDMTYFTRSTNVGSGIGTNFAGIPFNTSTGYHLDETNFSAQNSRIGFRVDSNFMGAKVLGYLEADFLFSNDANTFQVTSNSAGLRLRNYFVDVEKNGFEVMGGQDWSFLTPNRKGLSPLPSDLFYTQNMDTNYQVGLIWTRQPQFRFIMHPTENFAFGVSLENPQQYIGGASGASTVTLPANLNSSLSGQFQSGNSVTGIPNLFPDIIVKGAYDAHPGDRTFHVDAAGLITGFKDYVSVTKPPAVPGSHTAVGYGGSVNSNLELFKGFHLVENAFASVGGGRYIFAMAPDLIVRPDGSIAPAHSYSTLDGIEAQVAKNTLLTAYYGGAYVAREVAFDPTAAGSTLLKPVYAGYGYASSTTSFNRYIQEATFGWVQTLWKNSNYGALALINQYSYLWREPWYVSPGAPKQTHTNMVYIDLRYTLP